MECWESSRHRDRLRGRVTRLRSFLPTNHTTRGFFAVIYVFGKAVVSGKPFTFTHPCLLLPARLSPPIAAGTPTLLLSRQASSLSLTMITKAGIYIVCYSYTYNFFPTTCMAAYNENVFIDTTRKIVRASIFLSESHTKPENRGSLMLFVPFHLWR